MALGGSTNAVLHLLAIANEARVELTLDDFNTVAARVPHLADTKPHGKYHMSDLDRIGGVPVVLAQLLEAGLLHGDCMTVTGRTMADNLAALDPPAPDGDVVHVLSDPIHAPGWHRRAHRFARPEGCGRQGRRNRPAHLRRDGPGLRRRGPGHGGHPGRVHRAGHRRRDPLRGPEGRTGYARDAGHHRRHEGRRPRGGLRPGDRRSVLGRHPRVLHRTRGPRGGGRGPHRPGGRRRPDRGGRRTAAASTWWSTRPSSSAGGPASSTRPRGTRQVCWPSTPGW